MRSMRRIVVVAVITGIAAGSGVAAAARLNGWNWKVGGDIAYVGSPAGTKDVVVAAQGDINFRAGHIRLMSNDGVWQFVHPSTDPAILNAYYLGTATRTPITIGIDNHDVTSLIVAGSAGQTADLQKWTLSGRTVAAIDGQGHLRLGKVTLVPKLVGGRVLLYATSPAGTELIAAGPKR